MKEKPSRSETPSTRKCLPAGMSLMTRLMLAVPTAWVARGSSSHSSSSVRDPGLEQQEGCHVGNHVGLTTHLL